MGQSKSTNQPLKMFFLTPAYGEIPGGSAYIDLMQALSSMSRKSFRQGMNVAVSNIALHTTSSGSCLVQTAPKNWSCDNAITKAFETWKDQRALVLKEQPSLKAAWSDFKVYLDGLHVDLGAANNLKPIYYTSWSGGVGIGSANEFPPGEWMPSQLVNPGADNIAGSATEMTLHIVGDNRPAGAYDQTTTQSLGLIEAYKNSRAVIMSPDPVQPTDPYGFYNTISAPDAMGETVQANLVDNNNDPPYDKTVYPGDAIHPVLDTTHLAFFNNFGDTGAVSVSNSGPEIIPMGLIKITPTLTDAQPVLIEIDLVPGNQKGILAERGV